MYSVTYFYEAIAQFEIHGEAYYSVPVKEKTAMVTVLS